MFYREGKISYIPYRLENGEKVFANYNGVFYSREEAEEYGRLHGYSDGIKVCGNLFSTEEDYFI